MGIAALAFASCAKDTVTEADRGQAIDFRVAAQTRAAETTTVNITEFAVTALYKDGNAEGDNYFTNAQFEKSANEEFFYSNPVYYWPTESALNFYAYSPVGLPGVSIDKTSKKVAGFAPAAAVKDQVDFIVATGTGDKSNETTGVSLPFSHELSQIVVKAKNNNEGYKYTVKGFKVVNVVGKGDYDFGRDAWTLSEDAADVVSYSVEFQTEKVLTEEAAQSLMDETTESGSAMLLPQQLVAWTKTGNTGTYFAVYAKIQSVSVGDDGAEKLTDVYPKGDAEYGWLAVPVDTKWEAGNKYSYTLDFTYGAGIDIDDVEQGGTGEVFGGPIKFTTKVTAWNPVQDQTIDKTITEEDVEEEEAEEPENDPVE